ADSPRLRICKTRGRTLWGQPGKQRDCGADPKESAGAGGGVVLAGREFRFILGSRESALGSDGRQDGGGRLACRSRAFRGAIGGANSSSRRRQRGRSKRSDGGRFGSHGGGNVAGKESLSSI